MWKPKINYRSTMSQFNLLYAILSPCSLPTKPVVTLSITYTHAYPKWYFRFSFPDQSSKCFWCNKLRETSLSNSHNFLFVLGKSWFKTQRPVILISSLFPQSLQANGWMVFRQKPRMVPSTFVTFRYLIIICHSTVPRLS